MSKKQTPHHQDFFEEIPGSDADFAESTENMPLAARLRPEKLSDIVGQDHIIGEGKLLNRTLQSDRLMSIIFYGPPGSGKTTLAHVISKMTNSRFVRLNAVTSNVAEIRRVLAQAKRLLGRQRTILFIDEIHRFNKAQQDVLMPDVEYGHITLIGATTHNPSFSIIGPLLSRSVIFELKAIEEKQIRALLLKALRDPVKGLGKFNVDISEEALGFISKVANGDARRALNALEVGVLTTPQERTGRINYGLKVAQDSCQRRIVFYDKDEDYHYDTISAFIKSIRGSDPDAAVYWLAKMLYAGEDPRFIVRRLLILASEDIGNADPQALILTSAAMQAVEFVGLPEAQIILSQVVTYQSLAPKSNASYLAISEAMGDVERDFEREVPAHLKDSHYKGAKKMGHGQGYEYPHDHAGGFVEQNYMPGAKVYYEPKDAGFEKELRQRQNSLHKKAPIKPE